jgi:hypothetical protein
VRGKILVVTILLTSFLAGATMYYLQVYGFYAKVDLEQSNGITLVNLSTQEAEEIEVVNFKGIDADSSPIRFRACFEVQQSIDILREKYIMLAVAMPRNAPNWFECFNSKRIGKDLSNGLATAFLGSKNLEYGIDRYVVIYPNGRGYAWHELNECGEKLYDGSAKDQSCPKRVK